MASLLQDRPIPAPESVPLLVEPVELEVIPPQQFLNEEPSIVPTLSKVTQSIQTPYGPISVTQQGNQHKPAIVTYHDVGMNHSSCFSSFLNDINMTELLPFFYWIHIDAPGQEEGASTLPEGYVYPNVNELAEQVCIVVELLQLNHIIGLGVGLGANVLTRYAILSPEKVRGLVLVNLSVDGISWGSLSYYTTKLVKWLLKTKRLQETAEKYLLNHLLLSNHSDVDLSSTFHYYFQNQNPHNVALLLQSYSKRSPITVQLVENTNCHWLFIVTGDSDKSQDIFEFCSSLNPLKSTILELNDCGQLVLEEQSNKVATSLRLFLQGLGHAVTLGASGSKLVLASESHQGISSVQN